ncbi:hypothetical protein EGK70_005955 [Alcaligenes aquatilis]|uniref:Sodium:glutamate symporter n=1 Tax=Alcaligenes faecalis TaxID=511 RepID=A0AB33CQZ3_ALCFA|nr:MULTISPECIES: sodium:glutamate symporter [Alcaligenes]ASR88943.1 sodium:glutamate symporter [Alcaligenes faecalis]MCC9163358.1 hypothetical protein [Alcaligenes sp. MMA]QXR37049.1 hypothetical protein EGK70_005955 [Alcaligenes aquatilis]
MTIWSLTIDFGIASGLILLCKLIRANVTLVQKLFMPVALIAGLLGLALGPQGADILPFSGSFNAYGGMLIAVIFAGVGLSTRFPAPSLLVSRSGQLWAFNQMATASQWLLGLVAGALLFTYFWPDLSPAFGLIMPAGFMGGHGTAVAMGNSFAELGWADATTLALTSATVGVFAAILIGLAIIRYGARKGLISGLTPFEQMEKHHRKGLIEAADRVAIGKETVSASSIDALSLHIALILLITAGAYYLSSYLSGLNDFISVPTFACAFLLGTVSRSLLDRLGLLQHFDVKLFNHVSSTATDYLIVFGIASIKITVLLSYAVPLLALMIIGLLLCLFMVFYVAPRMLDERWFEKGVFSWGWMTGTVAIAILLLRIADPDRKTSILDDYAIAYVPGAVFDIILISFMPGLILQGFIYETMAALVAYMIVVGVIGRMLKGRALRLKAA